MTRRSSFGSGVVSVSIPPQLHGHPSRFGHYGRLGHDDPGTKSFWVSGTQQNVAMLYGIHPGMARQSTVARRRYSSDEVRDEPAFEQVFGDVRVVLDLARTGAASVMWRRRTCRCRW